MWIFWSWHFTGTCWTKIHYILSKRFNNTVLIAILESESLCMWIRWWLCKLGKVVDCCLMSSRCAHSVCSCSLRTGDVAATARGGSVMMKDLWCQCRWFHLCEWTPSKQASCLYAVIIEFWRSLLLWVKRRFCFWWFLSRINLFIADRFNLVCGRARLQFLFASQHGMTDQLRR